MPDKALEEAIGLPVSANDADTRPDHIPALHKVADVGSPGAAHIYKVIEMAGSSDSSIEDAIERAVSKASQSIRHLRWFEVVQTRGHIQDGRVAHYQVMLKIGFQLED
jgi:flavin-binding protein dodecin